MKKLCSLIICSLFFLVVSGKLFSQQQPEIMLKDITAELITELKNKNTEIRQHPNHINSIIERLLAPHVDWHTMSQWVVGRQAWDQASESQRNQFVKEFKDLLVRTYASTFRAYNDQKIVYMPVRGGIDGKDRVQISSEILQSGREPIRVSYRLIRKGDTWLVYDIVIEGVSLLKGFQEQFSAVLQQEGLGGLTKKLCRHNEKPLQ